MLIVTLRGECKVSASSLCLALYLGLRNAWRRGTVSFPVGSSWTEYVYQASHFLTKRAASLYSTRAKTTTRNYCAGSPAVARKLSGDS